MIGCFQTVLHVIGQEVETLVDLVALDASDALRALSTVHALPTEPQNWALEIKVSNRVHQCGLFSSFQRRPGKEDQ